MKNNVWQTVEGRRLEPLEEVVCEVEDAHTGTIIEVKIYTKQPIPTIFKRACKILSKFNFAGALPAARGAQGDDAPAGGAHSVSRL